MRYIVVKWANFHHSYKVRDMESGRYSESVYNEFEAERTCAWLNDRDPGYKLGHC